MLQNTRVAAFTVSELLRQNQQGGKIPPTMIRLKMQFVFVFVDIAKFGHFW